MEEEQVEWKTDRVALGRMERLNEIRRQRAVLRGLQEERIKTWKMKQEDIRCRLQAKIDMIEREIQVRQEEEEKLLKEDEDRKALIQKLKIDLEDAKINLSEKKAAFQANVSQQAATWNTFLRLRYREEIESVFEENEQLRGELAGSDKSVPGVDTKESFPELSERLALLREEQHGLLQEEADRVENARKVSAKRRGQKQSMVRSTGADLVPTQESKDKEIPITREASGSGRAQQRHSEDIVEKKSSLRQWETQKSHGRVEETPSKKKSPKKKNTSPSGSVGIDTEGSEIERKRGAEVTPTTNPREKLGKKMLDVEEEKEERGSTSREPKVPEKEDAHSGVDGEHDDRTKVEGSVPVVKEDTTHMHQGDKLCGVDEGGKEEVGRKGGDDAHATPKRPSLPRTVMADLVDHASEDSYVDILSAMDVDDKTENDIELDLDSGELGGDEDEDEEGQGQGRALIGGKDAGSVKEKNEEGFEEDREHGKEEKEGTRSGVIQDRTTEEIEKDSESDDHRRGERGSSPDEQNESKASEWEHSSRQDIFGGGTSTERDVESTVMVDQNGMLDLGIIDTASEGITSGRGATTSEKEGSAERDATLQRKDDRSEGRGTGTEDLTSDVSFSFASDDEGRKRNSKTGKRPGHTSAQGSALSPGDDLTVSHIGGLSRLDESMSTPAVSQGKKIRTISVKKKDSEDKKIEKEEEYSDSLKFCQVQYATVFPSMLTVLCSAVEGRTINGQSYAVSTNLSQWNGDVDDTLEDATTAYDASDLEEQSNKVIQTSVFALVRAFRDRILPNPSVKHSFQFTIYLQDLIRHIRNLARGEDNEVKRLCGLFSELIVPDSADAEVRQNFCRIFCDSVKPGTGEKVAQPRVPASTSGIETGMLPSVPSDSPKRTIAHRSTASLMTKAFLASSDDDFDDDALNAASHVPTVPSRQSRFVFQSSISSKPSSSLKQMGSGTRDTLSDFEGQETSTESSDRKAPAGESRRGPPLAGGDEYDDDEFDL